MGAEGGLQRDGAGDPQWGWGSLSHLPPPPPGQQGHQKTGPVLLNPGVQRGRRVGDKRGNLEGKPKQATAGAPPGPRPPNRGPACSGARAPLPLVFGVTLGFPLSWAGLGLYSRGFFGANDSMWAAPDLPAVVGVFTAQELANATNCSSFFSLRKRLLLNICYHVPAPSSVGLSAN